jgi:ligand-binding sensor domain-containing protein
VKRLIVILVVLIPFAQSRAEQLPIRTYTTADGLPRDSIHKIVPDPRGYLWFCTSDGLSRFDGYEFVNYSTVHGLPHRIVYDLLITRSGDYWAATANGLAHFDPLATSPASKFKAYVPAQRTSSELISALHEDQSGTIWVGTGNGLYTLKQTAADWQLAYVSLNEQTSERRYISSIAEGPAGVVWIGAEQGLFRRFADGKVEHFTEKDGLPHPHVSDVLIDPDGTIWVGTGLGLCRLRADVGAG